MLSHVREGGERLYTRHMLLSTHWTTKENDTLAKETRVDVIAPLATRLKEFSQLVLQTQSRQDPLRGQPDGLEDHT